MSSPAPSSEAQPQDSLARHEREELAAFIELLYWRNGTVPTVTDLNAAFNLNLSKQQLDIYLSNKRIRDYLIKERHVPLDAHARLTAKQLDWIRVACDPSDMRPVQIKMKELGITRADLTAWQGNQFYQQVMFEQATRGFQNARHGVLRSLAVEAIGGNVTAQRIYLEMTGDYVQQSKITGEVKITHEVRQTINLVLDVLQRHVGPEIIEAVAMELETATIPGLPGAAPVDLPLPVVPPSSEIRALPAKRAAKPQPTYTLEPEPNAW